MKKTIIKRALFFVAAALMVQTAMAQMIDPTVEVQRDFDGRMVNIHKSHLKSNIHDSLSNFNLSFNYSICFDFGNFIRFFFCLPYFFSRLYKRY